MPIGFGKAAMILLRDHMVWSENQLTFKAYPGLDHAVNEEMLDNLGDWLSIALDWLIINSIGYGTYDTRTYVYIFIRSFVPL